MNVFKNYKIMNVFIALKGTQFLNLFAYGRSKFYKMLPKKVENDAAKYTTQQSQQICELYRGEEDLWLPCAPFVISKVARSFIV